jgi:AraC-like DNA-binding protein
VGFSSQSYFNKCFKKVYYATPKEYFEKHNVMAIHSICSIQLSVTQVLILILDGMSENMVLLVI